MVFSKSLDKFADLECELSEWANFASFFDSIRVIRKFAAFALRILRL
jgi:hypothetical protein